MDPPEPERSRVTRRRPLRVVVGVAILVAIGLLWPFADWNWWPVVVGVGVLVLLYLLRLNWLLLGWAPHLAGLVTVALLLARTGPWAWGFAAGLAVLGYGLVRLPDWRVAAVGLVLTVASGAGYTVSQYRTDAQVAAESTARTQEQQAAVVGGPAELALSRLANGIAADDPGVACGILGPSAAAQFAAAVGAPDCAGAVHTLAGRVGDKAGYVDGYTYRLPAGVVVKQQTTASADGCRVPLRAGAGPPLGRLEMRRDKPSQFVVTGYRSCR